MMLVVRMITIISIIFVLAACMTGRIQVDATDYRKLCERAKLEQKDIVVLVVSADCNICQHTLAQWASDRDWLKWQNEHILFCKTEFSDSANIFSEILNTMAAPLIVVLSPQQQIKFISSGYISAARLKKVIEESRPGTRKQSPRLDNNMYTASTDDLYTLYSDVLGAILKLQGITADTSQWNQGMELVQHSLCIEPYFMNRYLECKYYSRSGQKEKADSCRRKIGLTLSDQDKLLYRKQLIELFPQPGCLKKPDLFPKDYYFEWHEKDKQIEFQIEYENILDKSLIIVSIKQSCNCLEVFWEKKPLAPHEKGQIQIRYHNKGEGIFRKNIQIYTNDPDSPYEVTLRGEQKIMYQFTEIVQLCD